MKYYKCDRFLKIQKVSNNKDVPSDWVEVDKNGSPIKKEVKKEAKKK